MEMDKSVNLWEFDTLKDNYLLLLDCLEEGGKIFQKKCYLYRRGRGIGWDEALT